jgi:hypothetical protein
MATLGDDKYNVHVGSRDRAMSSNHLAHMQLAPYPHGRQSKPSTTLYRLIYAWSSNVYLSLVTMPTRLQINTTSSLALWRHKKM